jgi:peroxiredoxin
MAVGQLPEQAPDFTLDHILGHEVSLSDYRGRKTVVIFGGRQSAEQVKAGVEAIRKEYGAADLPVIGVSDLREAPRQARILVKSQLKRAFQEATASEAQAAEAAGRPAGDPAQDVVMLMDWSGEVVDSFGVSDVEEEAAGVVVGEDGRVLGSGSGATLGEDVLALVGSEPPWIRAATATTSSSSARASAGFRRRPASPARARRCSSSSGRTAPVGTRTPSGAARTRSTQRSTSRRTATTSSS